MNIKDFNPCVRFCSLIKLNEDYPKTLKAYDFRLFYVLEGGFTVVFESETITVSKGETLVFPPNTAYRILVDKYGYSNHIIVNFDFVSNHYEKAVHAPSGLDSFKENEIFSNCSLPPFDKILYLSDTWSCATVLKEMCLEKKSNHMYSQEMLSAMLKKLLVELIRKERSDQKLKNTGRAMICARIKDYIGDNLTGGVNNIVIAQKFGYHPYAINAIFKKSEGVSIHSYITAKKTALAKELLLSTDLTVSEISEKCGFSSASYFSECFMKNEHITPLNYRKNAR